MDWGIKYFVNQSQMTARRAFAKLDAHPACSMLPVISSPSITWLFRGRFWKEDFSGRILTTLSNNHGIFCDKPHTVQIPAIQFVLSCEDAPPAQLVLPKLLSIRSIKVNRLAENNVTSSTQGVLVMALHLAHQTLAKGMDRSRPPSRPSFVDQAGDRPGVGRPTRFLHAVIFTLITN